MKPRIPGITDSISARDLRSPQRCWRSCCERCRSPRNLMLEIKAAGNPEILTKDALHFVDQLCKQFEPRRQELLARRAERQREIDAGKFPDFLPETKSIREKDWT